MPVGREWATGWGAGMARLALLAGVLLWQPGASLAADNAAIGRMLAAAEQAEWRDAQVQAAAIGAPFTTYVTWRQLRGDERHDFVTYRRFIEQNPTWPELARIQVKAEEALDSFTSVQERLTFFATRPPRTRQGRVRYAEALAAAGRTAEAAAVLRRSWVEDDYPASEERYVLDQLGQLLTAQDHADRLDRLLWDGKSADARRMLPRVAGPRAAAAEARLKIQAGGKTAERTIASLPAAIAADPGVRFERVRLLRKGGKESAAAALLSKGGSESGHGPEWWNERALLARSALERGDAAAAYRLAAGHKLTDAASMAEAEWLAGWLALRFLRRPADAQRHFERLHGEVETPISLARGAYWAGRAAQAGGRRDAATKWYETASRYPAVFYGQLAAAALGRRPAIRPETSIASAATQRAFAKDSLAVLTQAFCAAGQEDVIGPLVRGLADSAEQAPERLGLALDLALRCGRPDLAVRIGRAPVRDGRADIARGFPVPAVKGFIAPDPGLPNPAILLAVARQESQFDSQALSPAGARGLMQLMPGTAKKVAGDLGLPYRPAGLTQEPAYNLRLGSTYLGQQLDRWGELALALAAYNAGPSRVVSWLGTYGDPRGDPEALVDWIESIPFKETRNYVQRVMENHAVYRELLSGAASPGVPPRRPTPPRGPGDGELMSASADDAG